MSIDSDAFLTGRILCIFSLLCVRMTALVSSVDFVIQRCLHLLLFTDLISCLCKSKTGSLDYYLLTIYMWHFMTGLKSA